MSAHSWALKISVEYFRGRRCIRENGENLVPRDLSPIRYSLIMIKTEIGLSIMIHLA